MTTYCKLLSGIMGSRRKKLIIQCKLPGLVFIFNLMERTEVINPSFNFPKLLMEIPEQFLVKCIKGDKMGVTFEWGQGGKAPK